MNQLTPRLTPRDQLELVRRKGCEPDRSRASWSAGNGIMTPDPTQSVRDVDDRTDIPDLRRPHGRDYYQVIDSRPC